MRNGFWTKPGFASRSFFQISLLAALVVGGAGRSHAGIADYLTDKTATSLSLSALILAIVVFIWALVVVRRLARSENAARKKQAQFEAALNEAEAILNADPGVLMVWQDVNASPTRITGRIGDSLSMPEQADDLLSFSGWLAAESAEALRDALARLKANGDHFNLGIQTLSGELLEADGRAAGGTMTLRFRPLIGNRRADAEMAHETRKLAKQVQRLSAIIDNAPFPVWLTNKNDELVWVNSTYVKAVDARDIASVLRQKISLADTESLAHARAPQSDEDSALGIADVIVSGNKRTMEFFRVRTPPDVANFAVDVTSLDNAQKELELHIKAHASTLDKLTTAIAIFGPDQNLRFYNSAYAQLWQLDRDWLDSHPRDGEILDKLRAARLLPEQANYRNWKSEVLNAYKTLEVSENWWHLPDGKTLRVISEQHPFGGVTYLYENITEKIALESRYNTLTTIQSETLNNLDEGVALFGSDGKLKLHNHAFATFWNLKEEFLAREPHVDGIIDQCRPLFDDAGIWQDMKYCITSINDRSKPQRDRINRTDGKVFDSETVPLPDGNTLVTYLDVTDSASIERALRERNEALESADRLKTHFLSNVSYELRTPLTNILGFAEGLSIGIAGELKKKQAEYLDHIQASSNDLLSIIDAILDLTTIDAGAMELHLGDVNVAELMEKTARSVSDKMAQANLTINIEIADNLDTFRADEKRVSQILRHLLSNAIGFSPANATVRLGAKRDGNDVVMWVADSGRGIDPEFQKHAFDRFQSQPIASGHRGPGLGLALVKSFIELHGGSVSLLSKLERGTTVICRFPLDGPQSRETPHNEMPQVLAG